MDPLLLSAFPRALADEVHRASESLAPATRPTVERLIQDSYQRRWGRIVIDGEVLKIPYRHYQVPAVPATDPAAEVVRQAWLTRSSDGQVRQQAIQHLLRAPAPWHVPFVVQLCGEYVIEIGDDIAEYVESNLAQDPVMIEAYSQFWRNNPEFISLTHARVASYWDAYYRGKTSLREYPPHVALKRTAQLVTP